MSDEYIEYLLDKNPQQIERELFGNWQTEAQAMSDNIQFEWSEFTEEEYPVTTCHLGGLSASVRLCNTRPETGWGNRYWEVKNRDGVVLGSGYTLGSADGRKLCTAVMSVWSDIVPSGYLSRNMADWRNPRAG